MRVTELVREVKVGPRQTYSPREVHMAIRELAGATRVVTLSGGSADARAELCAAMRAEMRANPDWSLVSLAQLHVSVTGREPDTSGSFKGFAEALFEAAQGSHGRLGYADQQTFTNALSTSGQKIHAALTGLAFNARAKIIAMIDADRWPPQLVAELSRVASHAQHGNFKIVIAGTAADKLIPAGAPTQQVSSITLP